MEQYDGRSRLLWLVVLIDKLWLNNDTLYITLLCRGQGKMMNKIPFFFF